MWNKKWGKIVESQFKFIPIFIPFSRNGTRNQNRDPSTCTQVPRFLQVYLSSIFISLTFITPTPSHFLSLTLAFSVIINKTTIEFTIVYYETIKQELKRRLIYEFRCDERLKTKVEGSTRLEYTGLLGGLERLKIETRLIDERFVSVFLKC